MYFNLFTGLGIWMCLSLVQFGEHRSAAAGPYCGCFVALPLQTRPSEAKQVVSVSEAGPGDEAVGWGPF